MLGHRMLRCATIKPDPAQRRVQGWFNVESSSPTLAQHKTRIGPANRVRWNHCLLARLSLPDGA